MAGSKEADGFIGQSRDFHQWLVRHGVDSALEVVPEHTHFDILDDFARPGCALFQRVLALISRAF